MTGKLSFKTMGIVIALLLSLLYAQAYTQDNTKDQPERRNSLIGGSWSMQFKFMQDFTLTDFEGALISAKRHFTDKSALRFGLDLGFYFENIHESTDRDKNWFDMSFTALYVYYTSPNAPINFYLGFGPKISYGRTKTVYDDDDATYDYYRNWAIGVVGVWGVEWFVTKRISLICEYGAGLLYNSAINEKQRSGGNSAIKTHRFQLFSDSVDFGVSVYF